MIYQREFLPFPPSDPHPPCENPRRGYFGSMENSEEIDLWADAGVPALAGLGTPDEIFVREYVRTGDAAIALNRCGGVDTRYPLGVQARWWLERPEIAEAIEAMRASREVSRELPYSRELQIEKLETIYRSALADGVYAAANSAVKAQNELLGYADRTVNLNVKMTAADLTLDELRAMVAAGRPGDHAVPAKRVAPALIEGVVCDGPDH